MHLCTFIDAILIVIYIYIPVIAPSERRNTPLNSVITTVSHFMFGIGAVYVGR